MAYCINYNCDTVLEPHILNDCGDEVLGGTSGIIVLLCNHELEDPSNAVQVQAEIDAGRAFLLKTVIASLEAPSAVKAPSNIGGCSTDKIAIYDRTATLIDGNINDENVSVYEGVDGLFTAGRSFGGLIINECGNDKVTWINNEVKFEGGRILPGRNNEFQRFEGVISWRSKTGPQRYDAPAGIF